MEVINLDILRHPLNWVIIFAILLFWAFAFDLLHAYLTGRHPADAADSG